MNQLTLQQQGQGFCLASVGNLNGFEGKAFVKEVMNTTGMEVSFGSLAPGQAVPFNDRHKRTGVSRCFGQSGEGGAGCEPLHKLYRKGAVGLYLHPGEGGFAGTIHHDGRNH